MNAEDAGLPVRPLEDILRREAKRDLRFSLAERDGRTGEPGWQEEVEEMDRQLDPWRGARFIVHNGKRVYATYGQQLRMAEALAEHGATDRLALYF